MVVADTPACALPWHVHRQRMTGAISLIKAYSFTVEPYDEVHKCFGGTRQDMVQQCSSTIYRKLPTAPENTSLAL